MFRNLFKPKVVEKVVYKEIEPREGWFVWESGQNPVHCLWYCTLCSFNLKDKDGYCISVSVDEYDTFNQALKAVNQLAEKKEKERCNI